MLRVFFIIIFSLIALNLQAQDSKKTPESLEQINADLLAKKSKSEPFNDKDVKVDIESLGLDEIDEKDGKNKTSKSDSSQPNSNQADSNQQKEEQREDEDNQKNSQKNNSNNVIENSRILSEKEAQENKEKSKSVFKKIDNIVKNSQLSDATKKIQNFLGRQKSDKNDDSNKQEETAKTKVLAKISKTDKNLNNQKKLNLKKQLAAKKKSEKNEKKRQEKLIKLNELRQTYLLKIKQDKAQEDKNIDEDLLEDEEKIVPHKKDINKFISYETPAPPILNRYRSRENEGIPIILSDAEKVSNLFRSISFEDISYFNDAYKELEIPDLRNDRGDTILTYAIILQKYKVISSILAKGANPNLHNNLGFTPLQIAIEMSDLASVNLLVNGNADVNYTDGFGRTQLMHAARLGFLPAIDLLIKKGADVNAIDNDGFTALAIASRYKQDLAVTLLLKNGAKPWIEKPYDPDQESVIKELENKWK
ncbi:MAG: ankyrin repeat domain-containing protein [Rickettsiales bacterium]|nr:ankyrin repeat domain-containing protein [Rickettsiales bacterium]